MSQNILSNQQILSDKWLAVALALLVAITPFSLDTYLPAIPAMANSFAVNIHIIEKTLGIFLLGSALGQLIGGPLSDIKGRKLISIIGLIIYLSSSLIIYYSTSIEQLMFIRFIQAFGAGMATVVVMAIVRDTYEGPKAASIFALIGIIMMAAPILSPIVGAVMQAHYGWRSIFLLLTVYGVFLLLLTTFFLKESNVQTSKFSVKTFSLIGQQYLVVFKNKRALGFLFFQAFSFASMFAFLTESPFVYMEFYGVSPETYPILFSLNIIVMGVFNRITARKLKTSQPIRILPYGILIQLLSNSVLFVAVWLFNPPIEVVVILVMLSVGSQGLIVANVIACYMEYFAKGSGTANAVMGTSQFIIAAIMGWFTTLLHDGSLQPMATMMVVSTIIGIVLLLGLSRAAFIDNSVNNLANNKEQ